MKTNNDIINFYLEFSKLKNNLRQGWITKEIGLSIEKCESIADHSYSLSLLALTYVEKYNLNINLTKILKMSLIHDLCEVYTKDYTPIDNISKEEKFNQESTSIKKLLQNLKYNNDYYKLWIEYEKELTEESKLLKQLDKFDFLLQAASYNYDISYFKRSINSITNELILKDLNNLIEITKGKEIPSIHKENN